MAEDMTALLGELIDATNRVAAVAHRVAATVTEGTPAAPAAEELSVPAADREEDFDADEEDENEETAQ
jgi:hypothetical protein